MTSKDQYRNPMTKKCRFKIIGLSHISGYTLVYPRLCSNATKNSGSFSVLPYFFKNDIDIHIGYSFELSRVEHLVGRHQYYGISHCPAELSCVRVLSPKYDKQRTNFRIKWHRIDFYRPIIKKITFIAYLCD